MKNKKIIFEASSPHSELLLSSPIPATNIVPEWFKKQKNYSNNENNILKAHKQKNNFSATYKMCVPVTDSMTSGYMILNSTDILVQNVGNETQYIPYINWKTTFDVIDLQKPEAIANYPIPVGFNSEPFRWLHDWKIITPNGYSLFITHPMHRHDLPFFTLSAIVDTDKHPNRLLLPFFIKNGFEGIIEEGTPIAQIMPFKRDSWKSEKKSFKNETSIIYDNFMKLNYTRTYKNKIWNRKKYE